MPRPFDLPRPEPVPRQDGSTFSRLVDLMRQLLGPEGCPWDREQTPESLRPYVLEEACEVIDAVDSGDAAALCEELGDLLLQVVFQAELAREQARFGPDDVVRAICEKLVRRHPHVFGDVSVSGSDEVVRNWERIKRGEKSARPVLGGLPRAYPALARAQRMAERASRVGFDWPDAHGPRAKVAEELAELDQAIAGGDAASIEHEIGDLLLSVSNLARHQGLDAEAALRASADRFEGRFGYVEDRVRERHGGWPETRLPIEELDGYWDEAKRRLP
jgi:MazG family protein